MGLSLPLLGRSSTAAAKLRITALEVFVVPVNARGDWTFVRLKTNLGLTGLGEASQAGAREEVQAALKECFDLVRGRSPFDIKAYRQSGWSTAKSGGPPQRVAFAAIEHALWDLAGKALDAPVYQLFGGKLREAVQVYANINRATDDRSPRGFAANAGRAASEGFEAVKAAPFDGYPPSVTAATDLRKAAGLGVACVEAMREAIGPERDLMIDCHTSSTFLWQWKPRGGSKRRDSRGTRNRSPPRASRNCRTYGNPSRSGSPPVNGCSAWRDSF